MILNRWVNRSLFHKLMTSFGVMILLAALTGGAGLFFTERTGRFGAHVGLEIAPLQDAAWEMRTLVLEAHLHMEELLNQEEGVDFEGDVMTRLNRAREIGAIMLQGGINGSVTVMAVRDETVRKHLTDFQEQIALLAAQARALLEARQRLEGAGSPMDNRYDALYTELQGKLVHIHDTPSVSPDMRDQISQVRYQLANNHLFLEELLAKDAFNRHSLQEIRTSYEEMERLLSQMPGLETGDRRVVLVLLHDLRNLTGERADHFAARVEAERKNAQAFSRTFARYMTEAHKVELDLETLVVRGMNEMREGVAFSRDIMLLVLFAGLLTGLGLAWNLALGTSRPIKELTRTMEGIAESGDFSQRVAEDQEGTELRQLAATFNHMAAMTDEQNWIKAMEGRITTVVQEARDHVGLARGVINELTPALSCGLGVVLLWDEIKDLFMVCGTYGVGMDRLKSMVALGDGLVGQSAALRAPVLLEEVPGDYPAIASALGEGRPLAVLALPIIHQNVVLGVIELATFGRFLPVHRLLLEKLLPTLALGIEGLNRLHQTELLLEEAQRQAEELELQQTELSQSNESLNEQTRRLEESENELKAQQEELKAANEELESKAEVLLHNQKELENAHAEVAAKAASLEQASRYKSEFLANMSHELRTPLNSLLILSRLFMDNESGNLNEEQLEAARIIHESGHDLLALINDILDLAKIEAGRVELSLAPVEVEDFATKLKEQFHALAREKELVFEVVVDPGFPESWTTDARKVEQVAKNLISNAIKFTAAGQVRVALGPMAEGFPREVGVWEGYAAGREMVTLSVSDSGIGIPEEKQELIFEAFQQVDGSISRTYGGTGLGLSISRELARLMGGDILVQSRKGEGSVFHLVLPLVPDPVTGTEAPAPAVVTPAPPPMELPEPLPEQTPALADDRAEVSVEDKVVLVIEDDGNFFSLIRRIANKKGYKCLNATTGAEGLELAIRYPLHGIILDPGLPDIDGMTVLKRLKENPHTRAIPVHVISAREFGREILGKGAIGALHKPVTVDQINQVCKRFEKVAGERPRHVLLAEDDKESAQATMILMKKMHAKVEHAESGKKVLELLRKHHFDCLVLDLGLPDMNGLDLLDRMVGSDLPYMPPVIVYSGKELTREEHQRLREYTSSIVLKGVESGERLLEEISLFLHSVAEAGKESKRHQGSPGWVGHEEEILFQNKSVLVVDDDMRNTFALKRFLAAKGVNVMVATNGLKAMEVLDAPTTGHIHLVLMDIMMPLMDGYQTIVAMRKHSRWEKTPIIVLSAKAMVEDRFRCLEAGANDFLPKPLDLERLQSLLKVWFTA